MIRLNLLPPEIKEEINFSHKNAILYQYLIQAIAYIFGVVALMFVVGFLVWNNKLIATDTKNDAEAQLSKMRQVEVEAKDLSSRINQNLY
jgi:hypothetical protein